MLRKFFMIILAVILIASTVEAQRRPHSDSTYASGRQLRVLNLSGSDLTRGDNVKSATQWYEMLKTGAEDSAFFKNNVIPADSFEAWVDSFKAKMQGGKFNFTPFQVAFRTAPGIAADDSIIIYGDYLSGGTYSYGTETVIPVADDSITLSAKWWIDVDSIDALKRGASVVSEKFEAFAIPRFAVTAAGAAANGENIIGIVTEATISDSTWGYIMPRGFITTAVVDGGALADTGTSSVRRGVWLKPAAGADWALWTSTVIDSLQLVQSRSGSAVAMAFVQKDNTRTEIMVIW